jgi:hypothetical protein
MQFKSLFGLSIVLTAVVASPLENLKRDNKPILEALTYITKEISAMTTAVQAFDGDAVKGAAILTQSEGFLDYMKTATTKIAKLEPMPLAEAAAVLKPGNQLITDTEKVVDALISKKPEFEKNSLGSVVGATLKSMKSGSADMLKAVASKLPANVASVGDNIGKKINAALDKGIAAFPA